MFSLGIGSGASRSLVKGIARAGNGTAEFTGEGEDLRPKVMSQLKVIKSSVVGAIREKEKEAKTFLRLFASYPECPSACNRRSSD